MQELEIIRHAQIDGLTLFFDTVSYRTPHFHPEWELIWVTEGRLEIRCQAEQGSGQAGDLFLFCPGRVHEFSGGATFLCLQMSPELFADACPALNRYRTEGFALRLPEAELFALRSQMRELTRVYLERGSFYELGCLARAALLLKDLLTALPGRTISPEEQRMTDKRNARLERFLRFVDENYSHKLRLQDFAEAEDCTVSYLSRFLREALNQSFQDYVRAVRFHAACRLIAEGEMRMLDVCAESGFSDYRYFSETFKREIHCTPEEYSRLAVRPEAQAMRRSLHSLERFYTREQSLALLDALRP